MAKKEKEINLDDLLKKLIRLYGNAEFRNLQGN